MGTRTLFDEAGGRERGPVSNDDARRHPRSRSADRHREFPRQAAGGALRPHAQVVSDRRARRIPYLAAHVRRSEEHTSELQSLMRISYAVFCLKKKTNTITNITVIDICNNTTQHHEFNEHR